MRGIPEIVRSFAHNTQSRLLAIQLEQHEELAVRVAHRTHVPQTPTICWLRENELNAPGRHMQLLHCTIPVVSEEQQLVVDSRESADVDSLLVFAESERVERVLPFDAERICRRRWKDRRRDTVHYRNPEKNAGKLHSHGIHIQNMPAIESLYDFFEIERGFDILYTLEFSSDLACFFAGKKAFCREDQNHLALSASSWSIIF